MAAICEQCCCWTAALCVLLDLSPPNLAEAVDRRRAHPRRAGARLAPVLGRAADAGSRATSRSRRHRAGCVPGECGLRGGRTRTAGIPSPRCQHGDRSAAHWCADLWHRDWWGGGGRSHCRILAQPGRGNFRDETHDLAGADIPGDARIVHLRHPPSPALRSPPHPPPGASARARAAVSRRAGPGAWCVAARGCHRAPRSAARLADHDTGVVVPADCWRSAAGAVPPGAVADTGGPPVFSRTLRRTPAVDEHRGAGGPRVELRHHRPIDRAADRRGLAPDLRQCPDAPGRQFELQQRFGAGSGIWSRRTPDVADCHQGALRLAEAARALAR